MQQPNVKYTITDGVITIAPGVERIEEGTFIEVDFKEMHVPASVKVLEYPLDLSEQLEADLYLYGSDTEIRFTDYLSCIVKACIHVIPEYEPHYVEQLDETHPANWREAISIEPMPTDKLHHYDAVEVRGANEKPSPQQQAKLMALEGEYQRMLAEWEVQCAEPFAATLAELRAEEDTFKSSFKLVERRFWQFPFCDKPQPKKAHNRISFALRYGQYLVDEFNATATTIKANTAKVDALMRGAKVRSISSAIKRMQQLARIELFMSYATDAGSDADRINMWYWGRRKIDYVMKYDLMPYLRKAGMKEVICSHIGGNNIIPELKDDVIVMEYQGRRAAITCHDHYPVTCIRFYPNYPWTTPLSPSERKEHCIDFQVLALNAVTAYLKLMPTLWEAE